MDRERIQEIIRIAKDSPVTELRVREGDLEVRVVKPAPAAPQVVIEGDGVAATGDLPDGNDLVTVTATKVGFFHRGKGPASPPLVDEGDDVSACQAVATLEALRKLTDVTADTSGVIVSFHVEDGSAVEFGQPLIDIRPSKGAADGDSI